MLTKKIFKAYDIRGLYPSEVNESSVEIITKALGDLWEPGLIVIAHDGRHGSVELARTLEQALPPSFTVEFVGLATTPMFYFLVNHLEAAGGAMITASHNPKEYNGIKAVRRGAVPLSGTEILSVIETRGYES